MRTQRRYAGILCGMLAAALTLGCGSGDDGDSDGGGSTNRAINISGGFVGQRSNTNGSALLNFDFDQIGNELTGSFVDSSLGSGVINGSISDTNLNFLTILNAGDIIIEWTGFVNADSTALQGAWNMIIGGSANGEWTASR